MKPSSFARFFRGAAPAALLLLLASPAVADGIIYTGTSVIFEGSATGSNGFVSARATFTTSGSNVLKLLLENTSPSASQAPANLLTSFYFNVLSGTTTGTSAPLSYQDAQGQVYFTLKDDDDFPVSYVPPMSGTAAFYVDPPQPSNLQAFNLNDDTWQFKSGLSLVASQPPLAFGVGTVGNDSLAPDNFNGNIVDGFNFGIYVGEVATQALDESLLVKDSIHFEFAGFSGFSLAQISPHGVFGFGTDPELIVTVPEPAGLTALLAACAAWLGWRGRQRMRAVVAASGGLWSACLVAALAIALLTALPVAKAVPIVDDLFDFSLGNGGWSGTPVGKPNGNVPPATDGKRWTYANPLWSVNWSPVDGPNFATGNYLTSGTINPAQQIGGDGLIDTFRISLSHKFDFGSSINGIPPAAGQIAYKINGDPWTAIPAALFQQGTLTSFTPSNGVFTTSSPFLAAAVNQTALVAPSFVPPVAPYSDLFPLLNGGASFTGSTPGYTPTGGNLVPSVAVVTLPALVRIESFQLRLINANLGSQCASTAGWDVRLVQADFAAPEPGSLVLAAFGIAGTVGWRLAKGRRGGRRTLEEHGLPQPRDNLQDRAAATFAAPEPVLQ